MSVERTYTTIHQCREKIGPLLCCSIRPNLVLIRPWVKLCKPRDIPKGCHAAGHCWSSVSIGQTAFHLHPMKFPIRLAIKQEPPHRWQPVPRWKLIWHRGRDRNDTRCWRDWAAERHGTGPERSVVHGVHTPHHLDHGRPHASTEPQGCTAPNLDRFSANVRSTNI